MFTPSDKPLIFVIDNAPDIAGFLPLAFQDHGYESRSVLTPDDFRAEFLKLYVDPKYRSPIFLIDIAISKHEDGWDLVDFIRKYDRDCLIFMFTGRVNKIVDRVLLKKHGANAMIYKPKDGTEILAQIKLYEKEREQNGRADGQAGRWMFTDGQMAAVAFNILFVLALCWFVGHIDAKVDTLTKEFSTESAFRIVDDGKIMRLQGQLDGITKGK